MNKPLPLRSLYLLCSFLVISSIAFAQTPWFTAKQITISGKTDPLEFLEYVPPVASSTQRPLIIYLHGIDSRGSDIWKVDDRGVPEIIRLTPTSNTNGPMRYTWNGTTESFVVLAPQCPSSYNYWPAVFVDGIINYAINNPALNIDPNRIILTGHSFGGGGTLLFTGAAGSVRPTRLAATAPLAPYLGALNDPNFDAANIANANLPYWGFHSTDDQLAEPEASINAVDLINAENPAVVPKLTLWTDKGHDIYQEAYYSPNNPGLYNVNGPPDSVVTIFEWFLAQRKNLPPNVLPNANAGTDFTVALNSTATLNASNSSDPDGTLVRYAWRRVNFPAGSNPVIQNGYGPVTQNTTVTGLTVAGTYTFELSAVDNRAGIDKDIVAVTVQNTGGSKAISFTSGRITTAGNVPQLSSVPKFSIETHLKYDAPPVGSSLMTIFRKSAGGVTNRIMMHLGSNNQIYVMVGTGTNTYGVTANNVVSAGTWYHAAVLYDGTQSGDANRLKLYVDGVLKPMTFPNGSIPATTPSNTEPFIVGGEPSCCYFDGTIDEVRVWNTALSSTTINSWKNKLLGNCHPNASNLVVYWPLDDNSTPGTAAAGLTTTYAGTITNGTYVTSTQATASSGCAGPKAVTITSSTGRIQTTNVTQLNSVPKFSIEAHLKYDAPPVGSSLMTIFRKSAGGVTNRIMMHLGSNNQIYVMVGTGANTYGVTANNVVSAGTWYHAAVVYDGTQSGDANRLKLYVDGVLKPMIFPNGSIPATTASNTEPFIVGGEPSCCFFDGTIDEVRVWNTALSSTIVNDWKDELLSSCHPNASNLVVYWPLDDNSTPGTAAAGLTTTYAGTITNGTYVTSTRATVLNGCLSGLNAILSGPAQEVQNERPFEGKLYPNPAKGTVRVALNAPAAKTVTVVIIDMQGRYVRKNQTVLAKGYNNLAVDITSLRSGTYFIEVRDGKSSLGKYKVSKQ